MEKLDLQKCHKLIIEAYCCSGGIERAQVIIQDEPPYQPREPSQSLSWCIYGKCQAMDQPIENVCCRKSDCVTNLEAFEPIVLDVNVIQWPLLVVATYLRMILNTLMPAIEKLHIDSTPCGSLDIWVMEIDK